MTSPHYQSSDSGRTPSPETQTIDHLAAAMHVAYEVEAQRAGWETQERSRVNYESLPESNKRAMRAGVLAVLDALYRDGWRKS